MIENKFLSITMFAIIIEALITYLNEFLVSGNIQWKMILSIILGTIMTIAYNLDILEYLNFKSNIPYIGPIITGIFLSRGSNYVYNLFEKFMAR